MEPIGRIVFIPTSACVFCLSGGSMIPMSNIFRIVNNTHDEAIVTVRYGQHRCLYMRP
jgi:hypothetical protein